MSPEALQLAQPLADAQGDAASRLQTNGVEWLVDNARTYDALVRSIAGARKTVWITQLALDADCIAYGTDSRHGDVVLMDVLLAAAARGVDVRILLNASLLLDTAKPLRAFLAARAPSIRLRGVSNFPQLLHAKMVIVDDEDALLVGSPFVNGYWDDSLHRPVDTRRPKRELGGRPVHDVSVRVTGEVVHDLSALFAELWNDVAGGLRAGDVVRRAPAPSEAKSNETLRVARTSAKGLLAAHPGGHTEILDALLDAIACARSSIYIEHQYLSARPVVEALAAALERTPTLELIVVLNQNPDITAYRQWQNDRLRDSGLLAHPRVGLFTLWTTGGAGTPHALNQVFVHSKVVTIDDCWATVGSANLDGVSLHSYGDDFSGRVARRVFRDVRNFDVNIVIDERGDAELSGVRTLRERLWREHLGPCIGTGDATEPACALGVWRERAAANVAALDNSANHASVLDSSFVLPYSTRSTPADQLRDVGVRLDPRHFDLRFNPGWLEVHASPNWVRNMFL
ncbi:MAG: hypothetical protein JWM41_3475 [Gemmatimonadetes bacterium]|nr:hypothetical protein [Gemmatimonadota bacterium]